MATKRRTVVNVDPQKIERVMAFVTQGRYRSLSDFVCKAVDEKLVRVHESMLAAEVARYCAAGRADENLDLIAAQSP